MTRSLQRHLSVMLGSAILVTGIVAGVASFAMAYGEAKEFQDDMLRQVATLSAAGERGPGTQRPDASADDPESRITTYRLPLDARPGWLSADLRPGFHTIDADNGRLRVYIRDFRGAGRTVVAQPTDARNELAINSAIRTLLPLMLLLPVLAWLVVRIVRRELAPITLLSSSLDVQPVDRPRAIAVDGVPDEIMPFVHAINRLLERVNHLMGQQRRFVADAAHELRSPLTALSVQAQNLAHAGSLDAVRERVVPLQQGIERARQLTEQLLSLARTQGETISEERVDVSAMARELIAECLPRAEARRIDLGLEETASLAVRAAPETLRLILKNALDNALKYAPEGGQVTLRLRSEGNAAVMEVVDNGPGIPAQERAQVFEAFYRTPGAAGEGSGLGLAIAREAAARLGGSVSLRERPGGPGLVFRYVQPLER